MAKQRFGSMTTAVGGQYMGKYPPNNLDAPGPKGYISARFTNYLAQNWFGEIGSQIIQFVALPSPEEFQYVAIPIQATNVKPIRLQPGGSYVIGKQYLANPNPAVR